MSCILLAGGEPMLRRDIVEAAGKMPNIIFPIFTNGIYMDDAYFQLFDRCRNLIPVMSIEGGREETDERRGNGIYEKLVSNMDMLHDKKLLFGVSVTVTTRNVREVISHEFLDTLAERGCRLAVYVEFVPVTEESKELAPGGAEPCPLSPYSDVNVRDTSLREALKSPLFTALREGDMLADDHAGGCVLYEKRSAVEAILAGEGK